MYCRICGSEKNVEFRASKGQALCPDCNRETSRKVGRAAFERVYWDGRPEAVPSAIRNEFFSDYLASSHNLTDYVAATQSVID